MTIDFKKELNLPDEQVQIISFGELYTNQEKSITEKEVYCNMYQILLNDAISTD